MAGSTRAGQIKHEDAAPVPADCPLHEEQLRLPDILGTVHRHERHPDRQENLRLQGRQRVLGRRQDMRLVSTYLKSAEEKEKKVKYI